MEASCVTWSSSGGGREERTTNHLWNDHARVEVVVVSNPQLLLEEKLWTAAEVVGVVEVTVTMAAIMAEGGEDQEEV